MSDSTAPTDRSWVVAVHEAGRDRPIGTGVVVDDRRVLTCRHVVHGRAAGRLHVTFPWAENPLAPPAAVADVRSARHQDADVAVIELADPLPAGVRPAPLSRPRGADLVGTDWWAYGFMDRRGNNAAGEIGEDLAYGWVRIDGSSRYLVEEGFSGGGLWSGSYQAVVGIVGQRHGTGDGRAFTLAMAAHALPGENLTALTDAWDLRRSGPDAALSWGWVLGTDPEGRRHWRPRARGVTGDSERGYRFRGRRVALTEIVDWLGGARPESKVLVVTGSPGVGKSAVLARVVTTADAGTAAELPADDDTVRAPVGSVACAVHARGKTALEVATEIARAASAPLPERVEDAVPAVRETLAEHGGRSFSVVVDALDEAAGPEDARAVVRKLLVPLAETCSDVGARVLVGSRRRDDGGDLIGAFGPARREIDLDLSRYFALEDLAAYALATLQLRGAERPGSPYADPVVAAPVAARIAAVAEPNFLVAGLRARTRGLHDEVAVAVEAIGAPDDEAGDPVTAALWDYLAVIPDVGPVTAAEALTALAYAEAPGLTLDLWGAAVAALTGHTLAEADLRAFARGAAANFLIETSESAASPASYRLFHQALDESLVADRDSVADQWTITHAFVAAGRAHGWTQPYLWRSLGPHHALAGRDLDAVLGEPDLLLRADLRRLIPIAVTATTAAGRRRARLLRRTPAAVTAGPETRLALLSLTEAFDQLGDVFRALSSRPPFYAVWARARRGVEEATLEGHTGGVNAVCAVRVGDRDLLATAGADRTVRLWDPATGDRIHTLDGHVGRVNAVCSLRIGDRDLLASAGIGGMVRLWDPATGSLVRTLDGHVGWVNALCGVRAGDRDLLATAGIGGMIRLWDPATGELVHTLDGHTSAINALCGVRAGDRDLVASAGDDQTVRLWDPVTGSPVHTLDGQTDWLLRAINAVCGVRVGGRDLLASASNGGMVRLWDPVTGDPVHTLDGHPYSVRAVCSLRVGDRRLLASTGADGTIRLWDPASGDPVLTIDGHTDWLLGAINAVCGVRVGDRDLLASAGTDGIVRLWDPATSEPADALGGRTDRVNAVCTVRARDRDLLASAGADGAVRLWDPTTGDPVHTLDGHTGWVNAVCTIRAAGLDLLASAGADGVVRLWDPATGDPVHTLDGHTGWVNAVCTIRAGGLDLLASAGDDGTVRLWDPATGAHAHTLGYTTRVNALCGVRVGDRDLLASAGADRAVRLWDPATGAHTHTFEGHTDWVRALAGVRVGDRDLLASASDDRTVRLWDPATGRPHLVVPVQYWALALAPLRGGRLAIGLTDGLLVISIAPSPTPPPPHPQPS